MTNPADQCKKKRKRDVFLFNHVFGGEGKNVAMNFSGFLGVAQTDRSMVKDPLLKKDQPFGQNDSLLAGMMETNDKIQHSN